MTPPLGPEPDADRGRSDAILPWIDRQIQAAYGSDPPSREIVAALVVMPADGPGRVYLDEEVPGRSWL